MVDYLPPGGPSLLPSGYFRVTKPPSRARLILRQLGWASMPLWSFGLLAFGPFLWLAVTRRRRSDRIITTAYVAVSAMVVGLISLSTTADTALGDACGGLLVGLMIIGTGHALVALRPGRRDASGRPVLGNVDRNIQAVSGAEDRMNVRNKARKLAQKDPRTRTGTAHRTPGSPPRL